MTKLDLEKSMKMTMTALLLALAMLPALAQSDAPAVTTHNDYTYVELGYQYLDFDDLAESGHGFGLAGGMQINDWFHLWAGSSLSTVDIEDAEVTATTVGVEVGAHTALPRSVSTYARVGYVRAEVEAEWATGQDVDVSVSADGDGYSLETGIRASVLPKLELSAGISLVSVEDESETGLGGGIVYSLTRNVALGVGISLADDVVGAGVGMRFYFQ